MKLHGLGPARNRIGASTGLARADDRSRCAEDGRARAFDCAPVNEGHDLGVVATELAGSDSETEPVGEARRTVARPRTIAV